MLSDPARKQQMDAYLRAVGSGADPAQALTQATGLDLANPGTAAARLPEDRLHPRAAQAVQGRDKGHPAAARRRRPAAGEHAAPRDDRRGRPAGLPGEDPRAGRKHPADRLAKLALAKAEISFGDREAAETILKLLLAADPDDPDALELMGMSLLAAGDDATDGAVQRELYRRARPYLIKASQKDPTRYQTLYAYARSRAVEDAYPNDNDMNALLAARALAPQVAEITLRTAEALHRRKRSPEAIAILTPVANDPHRADAAAAAKEVLARVKRDQKPPPTPVDAVPTAAAAGATDKQR